MAMVAHNNEKKKRRESNNFMTASSNGGNKLMLAEKQRIVDKVNVWKEKQDRIIKKKEKREEHKK